MSSIPPTLLSLAVLAGQPAAATPFFVFDNGLHGENLKSIEAQLDLVKELGFAGLSWRTDDPARVKEVLDGSRQCGLKLFVVCANLDLKDGRLIHDPRLKEIIALCKGTDVIIWPNLTSKQFKNSDPAGDDIAVTIVLKQLKAAGFKGPIGLQCYNIKGAPETLLAGSMAAWRKMSGALE